jgi:hypothetical protein
MLLYALAIALVLGLTQWRVWAVPLLAIAAVIVNLGVASNGNFEIWRPFNNAIFVDLVLKLLLANFLACAFGYSLGRFIVFMRDRLARSLRK